MFVIVAERQMRAKFAIVRPTGDPSLCSVCVIYAYCDDDCYYCFDGFDSNSPNFPSQGYIQDLQKEQIAIK